MGGVFEGKVALVTGASSGIGEAAAVALAAKGAKVAVTARRADRLAGLVERIKAEGGEALALEGTVTDEAFATSVVDDTAKHFGRLDFLINNAGVIQAGGVENCDTDQWRDVLAINLLAALYTCKAAIPHMRAVDGGHIVNVSSNAGRRAAAIFSSYTASKHALAGMTEALRLEVAGYGIRVSNISPGATTTEVSEGVKDPNVRDFMRNHVRKDGAMKSEDVADTIVFVLSLPPRANISELYIRPTIDLAN